VAIQQNRISIFAGLIRMNGELCLNKNSDRTGPGP
jgi:hypothetical protein